MKSEDSKLTRSMYRLWNFFRFNIRKEPKGSIVTKIPREIIFSVVLKRQIIQNNL